MIEGRGITDVSNDLGAGTHRPSVPLCCCFMLKMKALPSFETPVILRAATRRHTPVYSTTALCRTADLALNCFRCWLCSLICITATLQPCKGQWSLYVPPSGHYMYRQFNIQQFYVLPTHCIYVFCVDLRTNSDYFPIQH